MELKREIKLCAQNSVLFLKPVKEIVDFFFTVT